jgi:hypothetical protein
MGGDALASRPPWYPVKERCLNLVASYPGRQNSASRAPFEQLRSLPPKAITFSQIHWAIEPHMPPLPSSA